MERELHAIDAVSHAVDRVTRKGRFAEFELSNGIVLTMRPVPPMLLQAVNQEFAPPDPPRVYIEEKGRDEPNPNDPEYAKTLLRLSAEQDLAINDLVLAVGTTVKSIPEGYFGPDEDGWIANIEFANRLTGRNLVIDKEDSIRRYLQWLRFYAMETGMDVALATGLPLQLAGIREGEVEEVVDSFRSLPERRADPNGASAPGSTDGDSTNRATRRARSRDRGA